MREKMTTVLYILGAIVLAAIVVLVIIKLRAPGQILDGPDSVYRWTTYELYGTWVQADRPDEKNVPALIVDKDKITLVNCDGEDEVFRYSLPKGVDDISCPDGEVVLELKDDASFESIIFHEEKDGDSRYPVLSGTVFEYDGRGEIVVVEFVRGEQNDRVNEDFESSTAKSRNDWAGIPSMMKEEPDQ